MTTMPARTRSGKAFPGGRTMRRSMTRLAARQKQFNTGGDKKGRHTHTMPGSLQA